LRQPQSLCKKIIRLTGLAFAFECHDRNRFFRDAIRRGSLKGESIGFCSNERKRSCSMRNLGRRAAAAAAGIGFCCLILPEPAAAHITSTGSGGFESGFAHPLTGLDHFLAMFAVGLWGAQMGGRSVWTLPVTFPLVMVAGGAAGMFGLPLPGVEIGIALTILALGLAITLAWHPAEWMALCLIGAFAICHGYAHGAELPLAADPADYIIGFVLATGLIHLLGIGVGLGLGKPLGGRLARGLGALIGIGGLYFLVPALSVA
jgi:urease accessory protein